MNLYEITQKIVDIASIAHVNSYFVGDIYDLNTRQDITYPAFVITQGQHRTDYKTDTRIINYNLFLVDRLLEDKSNELEIQDWAERNINRIVNLITEAKLGYVNQESTVTTFTERFDSLCAGAFGSINITTDITSCSRPRIVTSVNGMTGDVIIKDGGKSLDVSELFTRDGVESTNFTYEELSESSLYLTSRGGSYTVLKNINERGLRLYFIDWAAVEEGIITEKDYYAVDIMPIEDGVYAGPEYKVNDPEGGQVIIGDDTVSGINSTTEISLGYNEDGELIIVKYTPITITSISGGGNYEKGSTASNITIKWVTSSAPTSITLNNRPIDPTLTSMNVGDVSTNTTYKIVVTDAKGASDTKSTSVSFLLNKYYGVSDKAELNNADVLGLANKSLGGNKTLPETTFNCDGGKYPWYCIPSSYGEPSFVVGGLPNSDFVKQTIQLTNASGYTEEYQLWRTKYIQTGSAVKIQVK